MKTKTIKLPKSFVNKLANLPESGMGYQVVKVILRSGRVLKNQKVLNSELLMIDDDMKFYVEDILQIEMENS
jgi:hypothetical protein